MSWAENDVAVNSWLGLQEVVFVGQGCPNSTTGYVAYTTESDFPTVLEARNLRSMGRQRVPSDASHLGFRWHLLPVSSHSLPPVPVCVLTSSCYTSPIGSGPHLVTSFNWVNLFKTPAPSIVIFWGPGFKTLAFQFSRNTIQPITDM